MAEMNTGSNARDRKGVRRSKKLSTRIDLTPMVDLGFLLITFFMITTAWSKPTTMKLILPADGITGITAPESATLTVIPAANNKAFYYHGQLEYALQHNQYGITGFSLTGGIGDVIRQKQQLLDKTFKGGRKEMILIIKPTSGAYYKSIVDALDEIFINDVRRHVLTDITPEEKTLLNNYRLGWVLQ